MGDIKGPAPEAGAAVKQAFTREEVCHAFGVPCPELHGANAVRVPADWDPCAGIGDPLPAQLGQIVVEVDLGPDDVLVLCYDKALRTEHSDAIHKMLKDCITTPGRQALVLQDGMVPMVLHRTIPAEDKARKAKPYLEDMARPSASERVVDADIQDAVRTTSAADVSRGTSEGSDP